MLYPECFDVHLNKQGTAVMYGLQRSYSSQCAFTRDRRCAQMIWHRATVSLQPLMRAQGRLALGKNIAFKPVVSTAANLLGTAYL